MAYKNDQVKLQIQAERTQFLPLKPGIIMTFNFAFLLLASATPTISQATDNSAKTETPTTSEPKQAKPKKICKSIAVTGSRLGKRECKTKEQWEQGESAMELGQKNGRGNLAPS
jgi:hypothetical protein